MRFNSAGNREGRKERRRKGGFTLAEVLAALVFMAIVIPVAIEGLRVANLAGLTGERRAAAGRIAERVLNEWVISGDLRGASQAGTIQEGRREYEWRLHLEPWHEDAMSLVTVQVFYTAQGRDYDVRLSTLMDSSIQ